MAKTVVYDKDGTAFPAEAVDAREMVKSGDYSAEPPKGKKAATLADVETLPGEPQYPPTAQPEHPLPTGHQILQAAVAERQAQKKGEVPKVKAGPNVDADGKAIQPEAADEPFAVPPNAPAFANQSKPAVTPGSPGDSASNRAAPAAPNAVPAENARSDKPTPQERANVPHGEGEGQAKAPVRGGEPVTKHPAK